MIVCLAPASDGSLSRFEIVVSVGNLLSSFLGGYWQYLPPTIASATPGQLSPNPHGAPLTIAGVNMGLQPGVVRVGNKTAACTSWNDTGAVCAAPQGVVARAEVVVVTAGGRFSGANLPQGPVHVSYLPPVVLSVEAPPVPTRGGVRMTVLGSAFAAPLPVTVWLVGPDARPGVAPWRLPGAIPCPLMTDGGPDCRNDTCVTCILGEGTGAAWSVVLVNHEVLLQCGWSSRVCVSRLKSCSFLTVVGVCAV
jgi:hypothetical protein